MDSEFDVVTSHSAQGLETATVVPIYYTLAALVLSHAVLVFHRLFALVNHTVQEKDGCLRLI